MFGTVNESGYATDGRPFSDNGSGTYSADISSEADPSASQSLALFRLYAGPVLGIAALIATMPYTLPFFFGFDDLALYLHRAVMPTVRGVDVLQILPLLLTFAYFLLTIEARWRFGGKAPEEGEGILRVLRWASPAVIVESMLLRVFGTFAGGLAGAMEGSSFPMELPGTFLLEDRGGLILCVAFVLAPLVCAIGIACSLSREYEPYDRDGILRRLEMGHPMGAWLLLMAIFLVSPVAGLAAAIIAFYGIVAFAIIIGVIVLIVAVRIGLV